MLATYLLVKALRALEFGARLLWAALFVFAACVFLVVGLIAALVSWIVGPDCEPPPPDERERVHAATVRKAIDRFDRIDAGEEVTRW